MCDMIAADEEEPTWDDEEEEQQQQQQQQQKPRWGAVPPEVKRVVQPVGAGITSQFEASNVQGSGTLPRPLRNFQHLVMNGPAQLGSAVLPVWGWLTRNRQMGALQLGSSLSK